MSEPPSRRRVRHLVKGLGPGGAERLLVHQVTVTSPGIDHEVGYLLARKDHLVGELESAGTPVLCLDADGLARPGWIRRLRRWLTDDPPDIVHVHSPAVAAVTRLVVATLPPGHRPVVVGTEHNRWPRLHPLTRWADRLTLHRQAATIAVSDEVAATLPTRANARVILHGIDLDEVAAARDRDGVRARLDVGGDEVLVMCVANLRREKALDVLVAAADRALAREPRLRFVHVGQGPLADELSRAVAARGLGRRFELLGYRDDVPRLLSGADVFTLTSRHEGLPVAVMEALALGVPVVATRAGGIPAAVGDAGILVAVDDVEALATAYVELARDPGLRSRLAGRAAARSGLFDRRRAVRELEALYREVATPDRPGARRRRRRS